MTNVKLKNNNNEIVFSHDEENNTVSQTLVLAIKNKIETKNLNLSGANLSRANLSGANFSGANFSGAKLSGTEFNRTDMSWANLTGASLQRANLKETNFFGANLSLAIFNGANLQGTIFNGANLQEANLNGTDLYTASFIRANLHEARLLHVIGNMQEIASMQLDKWNVVICVEFGILAIGCIQYPIAEWRNFTDEEIGDFDKDALVWCNKWKDIIIQIIDKKSQTGYSTHENKRFNQ